MRVRVSSSDGIADKQALLGYTLIGILLLSAFGFGALLLDAKMNIRLTGWGAPAFSFVFLLAVSLCLWFRAPRSLNERIVRDGAEYFGLLIFVTVIGAASTYPLSAFTGSYRDALFVRLDHDLWFNWVDWYRLWLGHPWLLECSRIAYFSIYASPAIIVSHFAVTQQKMTARVFIATFWLAVVTTLLLFIFMPGAGPLAYLWHGPIPYMPTAALFQSQLIPLIQNHSYHTIDLGALRGLVCAPSFHTTCAVLYIIAARKTGWLRWPLTLTNAAMLLSIPIEGTHYLIDMVGGAVVALAATWLVNILVSAKD